MCNNTCLALAMEIVSKLKLSHPRNEQGVRRAKSAGVQLIGEGEVCVKALQPRNMLWISVLSGVVIIS